MSPLTAPRPSRRIPAHLGPAEPSMFHVEKDAETGKYALVAEGGRIELRNDVWERLREPEVIFAEWKQFLQKWTIHLEKAPLLKQECTTDQEYRTLRTVIRTYVEPAGAESVSEGRDGSTDEVPDDGG